MEVQSLLKKERGYRARYKWIYTCMLNDNYVLLDCLGYW